MSKQQNTVIWIGLVLITFNLIIHAAVLKSVIFGQLSGTKANTSPAATVPAKPSPTPNASPTPPNVNVAL